MQLNRSRMSDINYRLSGCSFVNDEALSRSPLEHGKFSFFSSFFFFFFLSLPSINFELFGFVRWIYNSETDVWHFPILFIPLDGNSTLSFNRISPRYFFLSLFILVERAKRINSNYPTKRKELTIMQGQIFRILFFFYPKRIGITSFRDSISAVEQIHVRESWGESPCNSPDLKQSN